MMVSFGSGVLIGTRSDTTGNTPYNFGKIQEMQLDISFTTKMLYGQNQFPLDIARGQGKVTGKIKAAQVSGFAFGAFFLGAAAVAGQTAMQFGEADSVPGTSTYTITVANAATFVEDLGVVYASTGLPLKLVSSGPTVGQYSVVVATGVYTFAAEDASAAVLISYRYTIASTGQVYTLASQLIGTTPTFSARFFTTKNGKPINVSLHNCVSSKYAFQTKLEDYTIPEIDFEAFADSAGNVLDWNYSEDS
jgi:hypothetical protein